MDKTKIVASNFFEHDCNDLRNITRDAYIRGFMRGVERKTLMLEAHNEIHAFWQFRGPWRGPDEGEVGTCSNCKIRSRFFADKRCPECGAIMDIKREQEVNHAETE